MHRAPLCHPLPSPPSYHPLLRYVVDAAPEDVAAPLRDWLCPRNRLLSKLIERHQLTPNLGGDYGASLPWLRRHALPNPRTHRHPSRRPRVHRARVRARSHARSCLTPMAHGAHSRTLLPWRRRAIAECNRGNGHGPAGKAGGAHAAQHPQQRQAAAAIQRRAAAGGGSAAWAAAQQKAAAQDGESDEPEDDEPDV